MTRFVADRQTPLAESFVLCSFTGMKLIPLDDIRIAVGVKLATLPKPAKRHLGMDAHYEREVIEAVMNVLSRCVVVQPTMIGWGTSMRHGEFGVSEPHPFPGLLVVPRPPQR